MGPVGARAVAETDLLAVLGGSDLVQLHQQSLELTLSMMPDFTWCPRCPSGGLVPEGACDDVQCHQCKYHFCKRCKHGWAAHEGMTCKEFERSSAAVAAAVWLEQHTRACPKCGVAIEHVTGCSHMT